MTKLLPNLDWRTAYVQIADEIMRVSAQLTEVVLDIMKVFAARYIEPALSDLEKGKVVIKDAPDADKVVIPFFSNPPSNYRE
jgi:hypothetical protein